MEHSNIHIFHHVGQVNNYEFVLQEQIHAMQISGLIDVCDTITFGVSGYIPLRGIPKKSKVHHFDQIVDEKDTLIMIKEFCKTNQNCKILYLHTKGVTKNCISVNSWRLYMEYFCVHRWKTCVSDLLKHDCVGSLWISGGKKHPLHFSGNIWWANSSYINTKVNNALLLSDSRYDREFWIGSGNPNILNYGDDIQPKNYGGFFYENIMSSEDICRSAK